MHSIAQCTAHTSHSTKVSNSCNRQRKTEVKAVVDGGDWRVEARVGGGEGCGRVGKEGPRHGSIHFKPVQSNSTAQFQLHNILWVAVSSTVGLRAEHRQLQSVCLQDVVSVDQIDDSATATKLSPKRFSSALRDRAKILLFSRTFILSPRLGVTG
ncbi:hypothetical protein AVEN_8535-1 [Araneus ventricosus]|uniref:Uncharacterized protein n=1 Tax=Araneus ventricosus TaxID=182803 RepID=A0A4Y2FMR1_ARAVE|nr:hypothetical protein AVEN_8535-1 [Araneus ventricosus]